ncbi:MAG TPA: beta-N-acetylhexosaminidase [Acetobacteraceae bacterium]|nr:beta-N-acetylhexosaminidase [Acetobacteraceae bacterium]
MKPAIIGLAGHVLTKDEARLLAQHRPLGVILFARNIDVPAQVASLLAQVRAVLGAQSVAMVDQEGGRVARLRPPYWRAHPPARDIGFLYARDPTAGLRAAWLTGALIGADCAAAGFTVVAAPVLDVADPEGHDVIGDRAFASDPQAVAALGGEMANGLLAAGVQPVGKHAPGHGRARGDSHLTLPVLDDVVDSDLLPFRANAWLPWLMTAHIRYTARDMSAPATQSAAIIGGVIRATGFRGILITDDLAMQALHGSPGERAKTALAAGCDVALHCSGVLEETRSVLDTIGDAPLGLGARLVYARALAAGARRELDTAALAAERSALLA